MIHPSGYNTLFVKCKSFCHSDLPDGKTGRGVRRRVEESGSNGLRDPSVSRQLSGQVASDGVNPALSCGARDDKGDVPSIHDEGFHWLASEHQETADLAVVIVNWNVRDALLKNLEALFLSEGDYRVETLGFAAACNQGIAASRARHVLLLNPDMRVEKDALAKTVAYLDAHPDVAVVGGALRSADGARVESVRRFPTNCRAFSAPHRALSCQGF